MWSALKLARRGATMALWALLSACLLVSTIAMAGRPLGYQELTEHSTNMQPAVQVGDLLVDHIVAPAAVRRGEIITFRDPLRRSQTFTHRVVSTMSVYGGFSFVTKGDASRSSERWTVPTQGKVAVVELRVPYLGYVTSWLARPLQRALAFVLVAALLAVALLRNLWVASRRRAAPRHAAAQSKPSHASHAS